MLRNTVFILNITSLFKKSPNVSSLIVTTIINLPKRNKNWGPGDVKTLCIDRKLKLFTHNFWQKKQSLFELFCSKLLISRILEQKI